MRIQVSWKLDSTIVGAAQLRTFFITQLARIKPQEPTCENSTNFVDYSLRKVQKILFFLQKNDLRYTIHLFHVKSRLLYGFYWAISYSEKSPFFVPNLKSCIFMLSTHLSPYSAQSLRNNKQAIESYWRVPSLLPKTIIRYSQCQFTRHDPVQ